MKENVRQRALGLGFDDCRFTTAAPPRSGFHFQRWLELGYHGEMAYLARNAPKRANPDLVLAGAKTIITLATSYAVNQDAPTVRPFPELRASLGGTDHPMPKETRTTAPAAIARYARHGDYHDILADKLKALSAFVDELGGPGTRSLWYVDTGPLLERDLAQRAGLGFVGKHTNLISRRLGNWFFLSEIITTLEIAPDAPETQPVRQLHALHHGLPLQRHPRPV